MTDRDKRRWITPKLIILTRNHPGEYLDSGCKNAINLTGPCAGVGKCNKAECAINTQGKPGCIIDGYVPVCFQNTGNCFGNSSGMS